MAASTFPNKPPPPFALTCESLPCMTQEYATKIAICRVQGNEACLFSTRFLRITECCFESVRGLVEPEKGILTDFHAKPLAAHEQQVALQSESHQKLDSSLSQTRILAHLGQSFCNPPPPIFRIHQGELQPFSDPHWRSTLTSAIRRIASCPRTYSCLLYSDSSICIG